MPTTVFFASNRVLTGDPAAVGSYGTDIQPPSRPDGITYGAAFVDGTDVTANRQGRIVSIQNTNTGSFAANVAGDLSGAGRNLLVFIHGFDNSFEDAISRAAFNREFLAASGKATLDTTVLAFSWPSQGRTIGFPVLDRFYRADQAMAVASGLHLMTFFANLEPLLRAARANGNRTYLLAHSMGNLALQSAVENWFRHGNGDATMFDVALLAAADCAFDVFGYPEPVALWGLRRLARRISCYVNQRDEVLNISATLNGMTRLGHKGPKDATDKTSFPANVYSVFDATGVTDYGPNPLSSHQYYRLSPTVRDRVAADLAAGGR